MPIVRVAGFAVSLDGFAAGPEQSQKNPLGKRGTELHGWYYPTQTFQRMFGKGEGTTGVDDGFGKRAMENVGAWILGRNMFGPVRGPWLDESWRGWWGEEPPYAVPVFVLTHHARKPLVLGKTTFHFVTEGTGEALRRAKEAAGAKDVRIGGGASTVRQYLEAGAIDELHLAISPVVLGAGEPFWQGLDLHAMGFRVTEHVAGEGATHILLRRGDTYRGTNSA